MTTPTTDDYAAARDICALPKATYSLAEIAHIIAAHRIAERDIDRADYNKAIHLAMKERDAARADAERFAKDAARLAEALRKAEAEIARDNVIMAEAAQKMDELRAARHALQRRLDDLNEKEW